MASIDFQHTPYGDLALISMRGCEDIASRVDYYLKQWRSIPEDESFVITANCPRFGTGEAKAVLKHTARGLDVYIICDCFNYNVTYKMYGQTVPMSPDDHFQDLKRVIAALGGKARRITVIMPMLYEGRQHRRTTRESMDCAMALQELVNMGVKNILTFDAHDPRVNNAIPLDGFDNVQAAYQMIKALLKTVPDIKLDRDHTMIVSPDEGGMGRCIYYSSVLGLELGMFYKRRNYSVIVNGRNPIEAHEFLGNDITGKDLILVDDMISSGDSMLDIAAILKERGAGRIFIFSTFGLFVEGLEKFDQYYWAGKIDKVFTTNLIYQTKELLSREWYCSVNMSKY
ncbi:MAG: ribose-phosphate pyrophosphokinase, partial [Clostridia bacterium]|nr:ribose-phosphate pyrophosphokinase [Clostridia bacterium]